MQERQLRQALHELAKERVPDELDGWPAVQARLRSRQRLPHSRLAAPPVAAVGDTEQALDHTRQPGSHRAVRRIRATPTGGARQLAAGVMFLLLLGVLAGASALVLPAIMSRGKGAAAGPIVYGYGSPDLNHLGGLSSLALSSGQSLGHVALGGTTQGGGWALAPDGRRAYLLDREGTDPVWRLNELETPEMRVIRRTPLPNAISSRGTAKVVAVSTDGRQVYVQTATSADPARPDAPPTGADDVAYGLAIYDVARGTFTGRIPLDNPWRGGCGVASLFALPDGNVVVLCPAGPDLRGAVLVIDPRQERQVAAMPVGGVGAAVSADGRHCWVVTRAGLLTEVDLATRTTTRARDLTAGATLSLAVPYHRPRLSADGTRLFLLAAPSTQVGSFGSSTTVWVVDTAALEKIAEVPLPAPAFDLAPMPDGQALLVGSFKQGGSYQGNSTEYTLRLVELPSGRELDRWAGPTGELIVR